MATAVADVVADVWRMTATQIVVVVELVVMMMVMLVQVMMRHQHSSRTQHFQLNWRLLLLLLLDLFSNNRPTIQSTDNNRRKFVQMKTKASNQIAAMSIFLFVSQSIGRIHQEIVPRLNDND